MADQGNIVRVGMGVFIFKNGRFLIGKRMSAHGEGSWSIPGGHMEFGESLEATAKREVKEETGLEIHHIRFGGVTNDYFATEGKHYITIWMLSDWKSGEPTITEPDYFVEQRWVDFDNLPQPLFLPW